MRRTAALVVVLVLGAVIPLSQAAAAHRQRRPVTVKPATGTPGTHFVVSFTAPGRTGRVGSVERSYELSVTGSARAGCVSDATVQLPATRKGARLHVRLNPARFGGVWCTSRYKGKVEETQRPVCGPGLACPQYIIDLGTIRRFSFRVVAAGSDTTPPSFAGLTSAFACTPGPQTPGETTPFTLTWGAASDDRTPSSEIVYDVYMSTTPGGENFSQPSWTTGPGVTTFRTPGLASHGTFYFVVRARDAAGNEDHNDVERRGVDPCY